MPDYDKIIGTYMDFEKKLQAPMKTVCAEYCSSCASVCCREELCRETLEAPFLRQLRKKAPAPVAYSSDQGWLTDSGCALSIGRAPVCYHFLCKDILAAQGTQLDRYLLKVLAALINHVGKNALGDRHLVEIFDSQDLHRVKLPRFLKKLHEAQAALNAVEAYLHSGYFDDISIPELTKILPGCPSERHLLYVLT